MAAKTVEGALQVNVLKISKAMRQAQSNAVRLEWVFGQISHTGVAFLTADALTVVIGNQVLQAPVQLREFRKDRFQPHIQCLACAKLCHVLYVEGDRLQCRKCAGLIYESQRGRSRERALLKARKIMARLRGLSDTPAPPRPAGMWRRTYLRLLNDLYQAQRSYHSATAARQ